MSAIEAGDFPDTACFEHTIPIKQKGGINVKKRFRSFTAALLALLVVTTTFSAMPLTVSAAEATEDSVGVIRGTAGDCTWTLDDNGVLTISGNGAMGNYSNPSNAPWRNLEFTDVVIEDGVTSIGESAFEYCKNLSNIVIPHSVTKIGNDAFFNCKNLSSVNIQEGLTEIGWAAFEYCISLTNIIIPESVKSIGFDAFFRCSGLTGITIPKNVTSIGFDAFYGCSGLESITVDERNPIYDSRDNCNAIINTKDNRLLWGCRNTVIPEGVIEISDYAFYGLGSLRELTISNSVTIIGSSAFEDGQILTIHGSRGFFAETYAKSHGIPFVPVNQDIAKGNAGFCTWSIEENGILTISEKETVTNQQSGIPLPDDDGWTSTNHESFVIPNYPNNSAPWVSYEFSEAIIEEGISSIGDYAFSNCSDLNHIMIPDSVTSIGNNAFSNCPNLTIYGKDNSYAKTYANSHNIEFVTVEGCGRTGDCLWIAKSDGELIIYGNGSICNYVTTNIPWKNCNITKVTIEEGVTKISRYAFYFCRSITSVSIPESVTSIGKSAFEGCTGLTSIVLPNSVTSIDSYAFSKCNSLTSIVLPNSVSSIGTCLFKDCSNLTSANIPDSLATIGNSTFSNCTSLSNISIPNSVIGIGDSAFYGCENLADVTLPGGVTDIGKSAFYGCKSLTNITLPDSVTYIGDSAFANCANLTSITIPKNITFIGNSPFLNCNNLSSITVDDRNTNYDSRNDCNAIIEAASNTLIQGCKNTVIPDTVTGIGSSAFSGFTDITSLTIPESVTKIGESAFRYSGLTSITIPNSVTSIGNYAFLNCKDLVNINLPDSIISINASTFSYCSSLTEVIIPNSVTSIEFRAFEYCSSLTSIFIPESVTKINYDNFWNSPNVTIYGYEGSYAETYANERHINFIAFELGEINSDGAIDIRDVTAIQKGLAGLSELSDIQLVAADVNADKAVDVNDATHMQKYLAYLIDELG